MAKQKKEVRKITKTGKYTYYVTIPTEYIEELGWRLKQNCLTVEYGYI